MTPVGSSSFESKVTRLSDTGAPRFLVEFIGDNGENVAIECAPPASAGDEPSREEIVEEARRLARNLSEPRSGSDGGETTYASSASGLSRPPAETEASTHTSEGRDQGFE